MFVLHTLTKNLLKFVISFLTTMAIGEIHTIANYFTIALIMLGIIFEMIGRRKQNDSAMNYGWNSVRLGFLFALISLLTGFAAETATTAAPEAATLAMFHKTISILWTILLLVLVVFRMSFAKKLASNDSGAGLRGAYLTLQSISLILTFVTLLLGTRLVRTYGVGVAPVEKMNQLPSTPPPANSPAIKADTSEFRQ